MRTRTVCGVSKGDPPLVVSWLKDGQPLTPNLGVNVSALDPYSSLLSISSLDSRHSGDFTCVASNPASEVRYTAKLQVKGNNPSLSPYRQPIPTPHTFRCFGTCVNWTQWSRYCCTVFCSSLTFTNVVFGWCFICMRRPWFCRSISHIAFGGQM